MEISKGMYVRTHRGIARIVEKPNISVVVWNDRKVIYVDKNGCPIPASLSFYVFEDEITASSFSIIDLIEVGDYVNGKQIKNIEKGDGYYYLFNTCSKEYSISSIIAGRDIDGYTKPIENIVTKEQFDSMKYVVERDK